MQLVKKVYILTGSYPKEEVSALISQTRRAGVSISANIAEGMGRQYKKDTIRFLHIARGSIYELETLLNIAVMIEIINDKAFETFVPLIDTTVKLLSGPINYLNKAELK